MKDFNRQKVVLFLIAGALGFLFKTLNVPIPYMLGGIVLTFVSKTFVDPKTNWPAAWRNFMLSVGVLSATGSIVVVSLIASWLTYRMSSVNLISCFMGCAPGGMSLMTLMAEEDPRSDMNFVVVAQTLRFTCVVVSVPFLAMHMLDENAAAVALEQGDLLPWLTLVPLVLLGRFVGKKFHLPTKQLLGPILVAAIFSTF
ncbi:MAG: AbrB family transcriptional regulator, partial [Selenomonadaceae bacterium]|nr:AbrB family transcriptional regulator [Selenomonadaceae bacterium]